jgi:hypothetical protein
MQQRFSGPYEDNTNTERDVLISDKLKQLQDKIDTKDLDGAIFYLKNTALTSPDDLNRFNYLKYDKIKIIQETLETQIKQPSIDGINNLLKGSSNNLSKSELKFTEDYLNQIKGITNIQLILKCLTIPELETYFSEKIKEIEKSNF